MSLSRNTKFLVRCSVMSAIFVMQCIVCDGRLALLPKFSEGLIAPTVSCRKCAVFLECIQGIHDGRRHSYAVVSGSKGLRDNTISVSGQFFELLVERCEVWFSHHSAIERSQFAAHLKPLPQWVRRSVPAGINRMTRSNAVKLAAALLGVSERTFYRGLGESTRPYKPTAADREKVKWIRLGVPNPVDVYREAKAKRSNPSASGDSAR